MIVLSYIGVFIIKGLEIKTLEINEPPINPIIPIHNPPKIISLFKIKFKKVIIKNYNIIITKISNKF